ncbi:MAG TPA: ribonuclease Z [Pyrinomonadaceae bacterium]|nr:ribonuclease Z [Pyrinomonadaceae bacterium]
MSSRRFIALGTASQVPTRERNHNGYFLRWDAEGFLFDPGEGTQRQMIFAEVSASSITKIFITHFHGDHCLGLAGVLQRLSLDRVPHTVQIFYPASGEKYVENLQNASIHYNAAKIEKVPVFDEGIIFRGQDYIIESRKLDHTVESWGYRIKENDSVTFLPEKLEEFGIRGAAVGRLKAEGVIEIDGKSVSVSEVSAEKRGQSFAFVMDTGLCPNAFRLAKDVDLLVCESTYLKTETTEAIARGHLTSEQAAQIARDSNAGLLILTHFSQRYQNIQDFLLEAQTIHQNSIAVRDGDFVDFPKRK